ncbi:hypothetical protein HYC85_014187 [Camellia sinensis]|uniref:PPM-type phosphatase domain-containing protein n=1 Tax=Camellia sinensis TaxID=4442 RepID=A0A7J7H5J8_CAMSI|nr:hypothetical protein HYC85_014187 [Camellia sinensis]
MKFAPKVLSGSDTATRPRRWNKNEHILVDNLYSHLGSLHSWLLPTSFYAAFDGHGGFEDTTYLKNNAIRFLFQDVDFLQTSHNIDSGGDDGFLNELKDCHRKVFLLAGRALVNKEDGGVSSDCGTTTLTALVLGKNLVVANDGNCHAVICRKGIAIRIQPKLCLYKGVCDLNSIMFAIPLTMSGIERPIVHSNEGHDLSKVSLTYKNLFWVCIIVPLTAKPDVHQIVLTEDNEFLVMAFDGIWDVMSNQEAVDILCHGKDNMTAIVVCFTWDVDSKRPVFRTYVRRGSKHKDAFV